MLTLRARLLHRRSVPDPTSDKQPIVRRHRRRDKRHNLSFVAPHGEPQYAIGEDQILHKRPAQLGRVRETEQIGQLRGALRGRQVVRYAAGRNQNVTCLVRNRLFSDIIAGGLTRMERHDKISTNARPTQGIRKLPGSRYEPDVARRVRGKSRARLCKPRRTALDSDNLDCLVSLPKHKHGRA